MKKVLITGITGFIGSVLARRLLQEGYEVHGFVRANSKLWRLLGVIWDLKLHIVDLQQENIVMEAINAIKPEIIYHFAANEAKASIDTADDDILTNIVGTRNLLKALSKVDYELFVNAGSSSEYGQKDQRMKEIDLLEPNSYHSFAKGAQTLLCQTCAKTENKPIIALRLFSVYGPYERQNRLIPAVIKAHLTKTPLNLSNPNVVRDFIYVDDVVNYCMKTNELKKNTGQIVNIGSGWQTSVKQVVDTVSDLTNNKVECVWDANQRSWDAQNWCADVRKMCVVFKQMWHPYTFREGVQKTIEWTKTYYGY